MILRVLGSIHALCQLAIFSIGESTPNRTLSGIVSRRWFYQWPCIRNIQIINSNPVELRVTEVRALQLVRNQEQIGLIGGQISYPHTLTNTGNVADRYVMSAFQPTNDSFNLLGLALYIDRNQDGIPDDNLNLLVAGNSIALQAGESVALVATASIPSTQQNNDHAVFNLTATSQAVMTPPSATVTDTTRVTDGGVLTLNKSQSLATGAIGSVLPTSSALKMSGATAISRN